MKNKLVDNIKSQSKNNKTIRTTKTITKKQVIPKEETTTEKKDTLNIPWIEKYRPQTIDDLVVDKVTYNKISKIIADKDMPNIIITGIPGIGKTTTILCIAKNLLGKYIEQGVLELNASDDRGIKAVQDSIIYFCKKKFDLDDEPDFKYAKHKIILLDEADNMTTKAQQSINNLMEKYHSTTRFAFTCNNSSDIIEAIQSRCIIFRYKRLSNDQVKQRLITICEKENINYDKDGIDALVLVSQGDLRQGINNLQLTYNGYTNITKDNVFKLCDKPHPMTIKNILIACYNNNIMDAFNNLNKLRDDGYSASDISLSMINLLKSTELSEIDEETKIKYLNEISKTCIIISQGINSRLQLSGCLAKLIC